MTPQEIEVTLSQLFEDEYELTQGDLLTRIIQGEIVAIERTTSSGQLDISVAISVVKHATDVIRAVLGPPKPQLSDEDFVAHLAQLYPQHRKILGEARFKQLIVYTRLKAKTS